MFYATIALSTLLATPVLGRTIHSVLVFSRHGDRTSKVFPGYQMTRLGAQQCFDSGSFYRDLYIASGSPSQISGISPDDADHSQLWAAAPDESVLSQTALNFLQGLYPPHSENADGLANGAAVSGPLNGYQYVHIQGEAENAPDTIWLKGDNECPAYTSASKAYRQSEEYNATMQSSADFYRQFENLLGPIIGAENISYARAYDVFDLLNTAKVQNGSVADQISDEELARAKALADEWEWNMNYNSSSPDRGIGGQSFAGGILRQIKAIVDDRAATKFSLMTGSYDTFLAFFGNMSLPAIDPDFYGLPNYASTIAFELFSSPDNVTFPEGNIDEELFVRFLFRNGTAAGSELTAFPLGGVEIQESGGMKYGDFREMLEARSILDVGTWCQRCGSQADFCLITNATLENDKESSRSQNGGRGISAAAAGGIGAGVTLAVVALVGLSGWMLFRKRSAQNEESMSVEKKLQKSGSETDSV